MDPVSENLTVIRMSADQPQLWCAGTEMGSTIQLAQSLPEGAIVALPAEQVRLIELMVLPSEARHLSRSLPFLLEEEVAEDIDDLHFASARIDENRHAVAVLRRQIMDASLDQLVQLGDPSAWYPEQLLLPWQPGDCVVLREGDRVLLRWGRFAGTAVAMTELPLLLASLTEQPERWVVYGEQSDAVLSMLPGDAAIDHRTGHFAQALMLIDQDALALNLRQGAYAPRLPLERWWRLWRPTAIAASLAIVLQVVNDTTQWQRLEAENLALREAIQTSYRKVNPRGAVVDVEKQLDRQLAGLRGEGAAGRPFTPLLASVVTAIATTGDIELATLNYSANGEMRMTMTAADFATVEALRGRLAKDGMTATIEGTSARGDSINARMLVAGGV